MHQVQHAEVIASPAPLCVIEDTQLAQDEAPESCYVVIGGLVSTVALYPSLCALPLSLWHLLPVDQTPEAKMCTSHTHHHRLLMMDSRPQHLLSGADSLILSHCGTVFLSCVTVSLSLPISLCHCMPERLVHVVGRYLMLCPKHTSDCYCHDRTPLRSRKELNHPQ